MVDKWINVDKFGLERLSVYLSDVCHRENSKVKKGKYKKRKNKRQASSPLFASGQLHVNGVNTCERNNEQRKKMQIGQIGQ